MRWCKHCQENFDNNRILLELKMKDLIFKLYPKMHLMDFIGVNLAKDFSQIITSEFIQLKDGIGAKKMISFINDGI